MKKRILSLFIAMVMLFSTLPFSMISASASTISSRLPSVSTSRYISGYTLKTSGNIRVYTDAACTRYNSSEYISAASDECRIVGTSAANGSLQVSYPTSSGRKTRWVKASVFTNVPHNIVQNALTMKAQSTITTYKRCNTAYTYGSISKGDTVYLLETSGSMTRVVYPVSGGYKIAWAKNTALFPFSDGTYAINSKLSSNMFVDVNGASGDSRVNIQLWWNSWKNGSTAQKFTITHVGNGWYKILNVTGNKAMDVDGGGAKAGTNVWTYDYNGSDAQLWRFIWNGSSYYIQNKGGLFLDVCNNQTTNGTNILVWIFNGGTNQKFALSGTSVSSSNNSGSTQSSTLYFPLKGTISRSSSVKTNSYYCDYVASSGTPVYAPTSGTVYYKQTVSTKYNKLASYGNWIEFVSDTWKVRCCHLSSFNGIVAPVTASHSYPCGASNYSCTTNTIATKSVNAKDLLGYSGSTGNASGPHLHIEVYKKVNGSWVAQNPATVFTTWN